MKCLVCRKEEAIKNDGICSACLYALFGYIGDLLPIPKKYLRYFEAKREDQK